MARFLSVLSGLLSSASFIYGVEILKRTHFASAATRIGADVFFLICAIPVIAFGLLGLIFFLWREKINMPYWASLLLTAIAATLNYYMILNGNIVSVGRW